MELEMLDFIDLEPTEDSSSEIFEALDCTGPVDLQVPSVEL